MKDINISYSYSFVKELKFSYPSIETSSEYSLCSCDIVIFDDGSGHGNAIKENIVGFLKE